MERARKVFLDLVYNALVVLTNGANCSCFWAPATPKYASFEKQQSAELQFARSKGKIYTISLSDKEHKVFVENETQQLRLNVQTTLIFSGRTEMININREVKAAFREVNLSIEWDGNPGMYIIIPFGPRR